MRSARPGSPPPRQPSPREPALSTAPTILLPRHQHLSTHCLLPADPAPPRGCGALRTRPTRRQAEAPGPHRPGTGLPGPAWSEPRPQPPSPPPPAWNWSLGCAQELNLTCRNLSLLFGGGGGGGLLLLLFCFTQSLAEVKTLAPSSTCRLGLLKAHAAFILESLESHRSQDSEQVAVCGPRVCRCCDSHVLRERTLSVMFLICVSSFLSGNPTFPLCPAPAGK